MVLRAALILSVVVLCVCSAEAQSPAAFKSATPSPASAAPRTVEIVIDNFQYNGGQPVIIRVGDSVVWINRDVMTHTATGARFDTGFLQPGDRSEPLLFTEESSDQGFAYSCNVHEGMSGVLIVKGKAGVAHPSPSVHSMVVTGSTPTRLFLHHIALFNDPHHSFHVTLEGHLSDPVAAKAYADFRAASGDTLCIIDPELFVLTELQAGTRRSIKATFFSGQWETELSGLKEATIVIDRVVQFRPYDMGERYPERLQYQLYGGPNEVFLAHQVSGAPNFQHVIKIEGDPAVLMPALIAKNPLVTIATKRLAASLSRPLKTAVLANDTHILLSPPPRTLNPRPPVSENEELEISIEGLAGSPRVKVVKNVYFDVRILNK